MQNHRSANFSVSAVSYVIAFSSFALTGVTGWSKLPIALAGVLVLMRFAHLGMRMLIVPVWLAPVAVFLLVVVVASIGTISSSYEALVAVVSAWVVATVVGLSLSHENVRIYLLLGAASAVVVNAIAIAAGFESYGIEHAAQFGVAEEVALRRPSGLVGNANLAAVNAVLALMMMIMVRPPVCGRFAFLAVLIAVGYVVYMTGSRKGLWLLALWVLIAVYTAGGTALKRAAYGGATVLVVCVVFLFGSDIVGVHAFEDSETFRRTQALLAGGDGSTRDRMYFYRVGIDLFLERPLIGYGIDQFRSVSGTGLYSHSTMIELAIGGGLMLLIAFYSIPGMVVARCVRLVISRKVNSGVANVVLLVALAVLSLDFGMVSFYEKSLAIFWVFCLVVTSARTDAQDAVSKSSSRN